jgi:hypothetical protein
MNPEFWADNQDEINEKWEAMNNNGWKSKDRWKRKRWQAGR